MKEYLYSSPLPMWLFGHIVLVFPLGLPPLLPRFPIGGRLRGHTFLITGGRRWSENHPGFKFATPDFKPPVPNLDVSLLFIGLSFLICEVGQQPCPAGLYGA